jgi:hypothetical protein
MMSSVKLLRLLGLHSLLPRCSYRRSRRPRGRNYASLQPLSRSNIVRAPLRQITEAEKLPALSSQELLAQWQTAKPVLCIPGLGPLDEAMALILAQLIERQGIGVRSESADALSMSRIFSLDTNVALVCLCYVANPTSAQIRYAIRRLRRKAPEAYLRSAQRWKDVPRGTMDEVSSYGRLNLQSH